VAAHPLAGRAHLVRRLAGAWRATAPAAPADVRVSADELPPAVSAGVRQAVEEAARRAEVPGGQVVVRRRGAVLWAAEIGHATAGSPVRRDDRFVIASTTKLVVATLLAALAERSTLDLDAPVATWLPDLPNAGRLTPRLVLSQRSGLREYAKDPAIRRRLSGGDPDHPWTRQEVLDAIAALGADRDPDQRFAYRNSNYIVAAELAERASGKGIEELLRELVRAPLGLDAFSFEPHAAGAAPVATPHVAVLGRAVDLLAVTGGRLPTDTIGPVWGDGGIASSGADLARFTEALFAGELLGPPALAAMVRRSSRFGRTAGYGLGVMVRRIAGVRVAGHDGMYFGWTASAGTDDATATTVAAVTNVSALAVPAARLATAVRTALARERGR
jgi:D-alanyl-D-alanine carboxypeptidase